MSSEIDKCHLGRWAKSPLVESLCLKYSYFSFSCKVRSDSLWPHGLQQTRLPYPSLSPRVCWNSCPLSQWCLPTISSSVSPQSFPASGSFPLSWLFTLGGQSIGVSTSASVLQDWVVWSPCCPRDLSRVFSSTTVSKYQFFGAQLSLWSNSHVCTWLLENP